MVRLMKIASEPVLNITRPSDIQDHKMVTSKRERNKPRKFSDMETPPTPTSPIPVIEVEACTTDIFTGKEDVKPMRRKYGSILVLDENNDDSNNNNNNNINNINKQYNNVFNNEQMSSSSENLDSAYTTYHNKMSKKTRSASNGDIPDRLHTPSENLEEMLNHLRKSVEAQQKDQEKDEQKPDKKSVRKSKKKTKNNYRRTFSSFAAFDPVDEPVEKEDLRDNKNETKKENQVPAKKGKSSRNSFRMKLKARRTFSQSTIFDRFRSSSGEGEGDGENSDKDDNMSLTNLTHCDSRSLNALNHNGPASPNTLTARRKFAITSTSAEDLRTLIDQHQMENKTNKEKLMDLKRRLTSSSQTSSNASVNSRNTDSPTEKSESKTKTAKLGGVLSRRFNNQKETDLQKAVTQSDADAVTKLLCDDAKKSEINTCKSPGVTVFHQACVFGDIDIIQTLVNNGADVNLKTWSNLSPVKIAVMFGHYDVAKLLVDSGADQQDIMNGYQDENKFDVVL